MTEIYGVTGKARSGKNTFAEIMDENMVVGELSFAEPMRLFICDLIDVPREKLDEVKETPFSVLGGLSPRKALQSLGTEWGRDMVSESLWTDVVKQKIERMKASKKYDVICITDVRFDNEAEMVQAMGGSIVRVVRPGTEIADSGHVSEAGIRDDLVDIEIVNDGTKLDYAHKVMSLVIEDYETECA